MDLYYMVLTEKFPRAGWHQVWGFSLWHAAQADVCLLELSGQVSPNYFPVTPRVWGICDSTWVMIKRTSICAG